MSEQQSEGVDVGLNALLGALRSGQQADADGVMVTVSRQACEEAATLIERYWLGLAWLAYSCDPDNLTGQFTVCHARRTLTPNAALSRDSAEGDDVGLKS